MVAEVVAAEPGVDVLAQFEGARRAVEVMPRDRYEDLSTTDLRRVIDEVRRSKAALAAHEAAAIRELDSRHGEHAQTGQMLASGFGRDRREAEQTVRTAKALDEAPLTEDALAGGQLGESQARVIASAIAGLDDDVTAEQKRAAEEALISDA